MPQTLDPKTLNPIPSAQSPRGRPIYQDFFPATLGHLHLMALRDMSQSFADRVRVEVLF